MSVSRGVSQPDRVSEEPSDLFSEEEEAASSTASKANGVHSDDDNDLFAGEDTLPPNNICQFTRDCSIHSFLLLAVSFFMAILHR